jgi:hypothetical protein
VIVGFVAVRGSKIIDVASVFSLIRYISVGP